MIRLKRVYAAPGEKDGSRILVDRVWPRGLSEERARLTDWRRDSAPSDALRKWFKHDARKWEELRRRYRKELARADHYEALKELARLSRRRTITLLYSAADEEHNQAVVLKETIHKLVSRRNLGARRLRPIPSFDGASGGCVSAHDESF